MASIRQYILSLIIGSIICSVLLCQIQDSHHEKVIRMLCGLILTLLLIQPLGRIPTEMDIDILYNAFQAGKQQAAWGESIAKEEQGKNISQQLEAYILEKRQF